MPDENRYPEIKGRKVTVTMVEQRDRVMAFLRILAKGDIESYLQEVMKECANIS